MQDEILPHPPESPQAPVTEADAQAARLVTQRLNDITRRANRASRRFGTARVIAAACLVLSSILLWFTRGRNTPTLDALTLTFVAASWILFPFGLWLRSRTMPKFDAEELARLSGVKAIGPLFATLQATTSAEQKQAIHSALVLVLPQMKASDANLLTPFARHCINAWLANTTDWHTKEGGFDNLRIAALKALEQVGDASAIPDVERLATKPIYTRAEWDLQQAAIDCLPMLRANCGEVESAQTLLRASQSEPTDPDTLLRPASGSGQTASAELLRGADSPDAAE